MLKWQYHILLFVWKGSAGVAHNNIWNIIGCMIILGSLFASCLEIDISWRKANFICASLPHFLPERIHLIIFSVLEVTKISLKLTDVTGSPRGPETKPKSGFLYSGNHSYSSLPSFNKNPSCLYVCQVSCYLESLQSNILTAHLIW